MGSNMNALIDILSLISQQILFHFSLNTAEAAFTTTSLYENMSKLVNILNYKPIGKQTSMIPVRFTINVTDMGITSAQYIRIPRFTKISYNSNYYLKNEIVIPIKNTNDSDKEKIINIDSVLFEGELRESSIFEATGDEFETFVINDNFINSSRRFITDNFFIVYVDEDNNGIWKEYTETPSLYNNGGLDAVYERRFNEDMNYEFKFGNGINGKKFKKGARIVIFYLLSNGEEAILGDNILTDVKPTQYSSGMWSAINNRIDLDEDTRNLYKHTKVVNTGGGTSISYPESIESIRVNAPRAFASQNRLFTLGDYKTFIQKNFSQYVKDVHVCVNDYYVNNFLKYYFDIGLDSPQEDSRLNIAQVEFMTTTNFNNVYAFVVPKVNTIIGGTIPNYLNNTLKHEIVNSMTEYKGLTHNVVLLDPIYKAITFGYYMDDTDWNANQLENRLVIVRGRLAKYSQNYIKNQVVNVLKNYFSSLTLGSEINIATLTQQILAVPGVSNFHIKNNQGQIENKMTLFMWNPLYINEDNVTTQQNVVVESFVYPYFYNLDNIGNLIDIEDE